MLHLVADGFQNRGCIDGEEKIRKYSFTWDMRNWPVVICGRVQKISCKAAEWPLNDIYFPVRCFISLDQLFVHFKNLQIYTCKNSRVIQWKNFKFLKGSWKHCLYLVYFCRMDCCLKNIQTIYAFIIGMSNMTL